MLGTQTEKTELAAAQMPLEKYVRAHETGNSDFIFEAFHPDAKIIGYIDGQFLNLSVEDFAKRFSGSPAEDEAERRRAIEILDITGSAATGKVVLDYPAIKFTDYMALLKIDGEWKIVNKSFHAEIKS